ncbi:MAG: SDR family oxidoreductase [Steroidobacteraceae bacterium]
MLLKDRVAVIYGAAGAIGGAVARAFAQQGARLFLGGRHLAGVDAVAREIVAAGGAAQAAQVDALDEPAVDAHLARVIHEAGRIDVSFNAIGIPNTRLQGVPLTQLALGDFRLPIVTYTQAYFLTARLAARHMLSRHSGVIMTVTPLPSRAGIPLLGGFAPAMSAVESLTRGLSAELAPHGIRVLGLRVDAMPESGTIKEVFGIHARACGLTAEQFHEVVAGKNHRRRLATLSETANVAAFMASDAASAMTGTTVNLSMGALDD